MPQKYNRLVAYPTIVSDIYKHEFKKGEGDWDPNYLDFGQKQVSRVVVSGTIVDNRIQESNTITIDDGTGTIDIREFVDQSKKQRLLTDHKIGELVLVIGRIREFNSQRYILPEIVRRTDEKIHRYNLLKARADQKIQAKDRINVSAPKKIDGKRPDASPVPLEEEGIEDKPIDQIINKSDIVIKIIKEEDNGDGVDIVEVVEKSMLDDCEKIVNDLLASGDLFMVKPGRVKVL